MEFKNYSELLEYIDNNDNVKHILNYDNFAVVEIDNEFWYFEQGENDCDEFYKVELIAELIYDIENDIKIKTGDELHKLFDCDCCGECITDEDIRYMWFKEKEN